ncbi:MAG: RND family transporter [bacterium TMED46]|nr:MAG: RND family transporter [bacterium TMED46]|tara:strand:- start:4648 stop:6936 length:2289 start_codon:yes stop_codon:yes gene_type:complete
MNLRRISTALFEFDAHYPRTIIAAVILITVLFGWKVFDLEMDPGLQSGLPRDHKIVQSMEIMDKLFSGSDILIVAVESDSLFSTKTLKKLFSFQDSLEAIDQISRVTSIFNQKYIVPDKNGFEIESVLLDIPQDSIGNQKLIERLDKSGIIGNLVSEDYNTLCFIGQINSSFAYDEFEFRKNIYELVNRFSSPEYFYVSSLPITRATVIEYMQRDMRVFTPVAIGLCIFLLMLSFRSWTGVFLPFFVVGFSIIWTFGVMGWLNMSLSFIGTLIPVMLVAIANNYGIHIISHYYEYSRSDTMSNRGQILKRTIRKVGIPILLAGITTMVSFLCLLSHSLPRAREMGALVSFGILIAFILSIILIPSVLVLVPRPHFLSKGLGMSYVDTILINMGKVFTRYRSLVLLLLSIVGIWLAMGIQYLKVDTNPDHYFPKSSTLRIANTKISNAFGGSTQMNILVQGEIFDPAVLENIEILTDHIKNRHNIVTKSYSIVDVIKRMHSGFNGGDPTMEVIPDDIDLIRQYMFMYSISSDGDEFDLILDDIEDPSYTQILLRLQEVQTHAIAAIVEDTEQFIEANFYDESPMELTGSATLLGVLNHMVIRGQFISLVVSVCIILLIMSIVFRSFIGGLLATFPMSASVVMMFGLMGYLNITLNITTSLLTCILVGVGVDYTVHFLWHLRDHVKDGDSLDEAITNTFRISGKGILFNGLSVVVGFSALLFSVFVPVKIFGILVMGSISFCLFGALATLPALTSLTKPKFLFK